MSGVKKTMKMAIISGELLEKVMDIGLGIGRHDDIRYLNISESGVGAITSACSL